MSGAVIVGRGVGKTYRIPRPDAPRWADYVRRPAASWGRERTMEVRALGDVSFDVEEGEVLGIIGRNGAGKSTLLKILARITSPSEGRVTIAGRVASLLEVGTGFHPELTGRENVYLNGMLLGMSRREIDAHFDAICDFASVGPYINAPIKRYSSGMQLRLAFSVAAHLAADTMIIDEVLAVGDAEFQRKCLGAMRDVSRAGRTTLFVSHNMQAVESLCTRVMWLDGGRVRDVGPPAQVIRDYLAAGFGGGENPSARLDLTAQSRLWTLGMARLDAVAFERAPEAPARPPWRVAFGESFTLAVDFHLERAIPDLVVGVGIRNDRGEDLFVSHCDDLQPARLPDGSLRGTARVRLGAPWLRPGAYYVETALLSGNQVLDLVSESARLEVEEQSADGAPRQRKGVAVPLWPWTVDAA